MVEIRRAEARDAPLISNLLSVLTRRHIRADCTAEGLEKLLDTMTPAAVLERMAGDFRHWVAVDGDKLAGVCTLRGENHLYHLFVATDYQCKGVARRLWQIALDDSRLRAPGLRRFTVNASSFGQPAYERLGFVAEGAPMELHGIRSQPMRLDL